MTRDELVSGYVQAGGKQTGEALERLSEAAWMLMLSQSRGRIRQVEDTTPEGCLVQDCFRALVDAGAETEHGVVAAETLGQWSRTYRDDQKSRDKLLLGILREYLGETGLLYRGWSA